MVRPLGLLALLAAGCGTAPLGSAEPLTPLPGTFGSPPASRMGDDIGKDLLFGAWGDANVFDIDGRRLALGIRTIRKVEGNPPQARFLQQLGLYDVTGDRGTSGRRFHLDRTEPTSFVVADRGYVMRLARRGSDTLIRLTASSGVAPVFGFPGQTRLPTVNELFRMRAEIARASTRVDVIEGVRYRVSAESASVASLLFWAEPLLDRATLGEGDPRWLVPDMLGEIDKVEDGVQRRLGDVAPFCRLIKGRWWGLRWNPGFQNWDVEAGDDFRPKTGDAPAGALRIAVPSAREGKHHFVTVTVVGPGASRADVRCLVDTGATNLSLPLSLAGRLGFQERDFQAVTVSTANGKVQRKSATLRAVEISGQGGRDTIHDIPVVFGPDGAQEVPLLGMSVLGHYRMTLEDGKNEIVLERQR